MTKQQLRKKYLIERKNISSRDKLRFDDLLLLNFQQFNFSSIETVLTYWPIQKNNEPNTHLFSSYLRHIVPNLKITYPVCDLSNNTMQAISIDEDTVYKTNALGLTEPKFGNEINATQIDLVLAPLIVCDTQGYRVGYGKGYYDNFLAKCNSNVAIFGLGYFEPVSEIEDVSAHDIRLTTYITPKNIYEF